MWFDARRALAEIESGVMQAAKSANLANRDTGLADLANLADASRQDSPSAFTFAAQSALDVYEERAAIREYDGGQSRAEAEAAALAEAANGVGLTANMLRKLWVEHPDTKAYLSHLSELGPAASGDVACALEWDRTRAWQAEARLRASGLVTLDSNGCAEVRKGKDQK